VNISRALRWVTYVIAILIAAALTIAGYAIIGVVVSALVLVTYHLACSESVGRP
jgi:hypothetical protein